jgi:nucleotide-binding universal stress UspA family protein
MKNIFVINDGSDQTITAARLALNIAQKVNADLLVANVYKEKSFVIARDRAFADIAHDYLPEELAPALVTRLAELNEQAASGFKPHIGFVDASDFSLNELVYFINKNNIWMMIKGTGEDNQTYLSTNIQSIINRVACPLMLVPEKYELKDFERMAYMADLRYCNIPVLNYLGQIARRYDAKIQVAHVSAKGLPDMDESYARTFFSDAICRRVQYDQLYFNNIRDKDLEKVLDVLIHGMKTDLLVLMNHQYHLEALIGPSIANQLPENVTVPVLVFPC